MFVKEKKIVAARMDLVVMASIVLVTMKFLFVSLFSSLFEYNCNEIF